MKKTSWFATFVAILVAVTYYYEFYSVRKEEQKKGEESKVISFAPEQINKLEVQNTAGKILLKRDVDGWKMEEPVQDWADNQFVEDFVNGLAAEKVIEVASEGENLNWTVYGLDKDTSQVAFTNQAGDSILVRVSAKKNFEGHSFIRRGNENRALVSSSQWVLRTTKNPLEFRDRRMFRGKIGSVDGIQVKSEKEDFKLSLKDGKWASEKHPEITLDQNKVRELLTSLNEVRANAFLDKAPAGDLRTRITLQMKEKSWSADIKQSKDKTFFAIISDPAFILKLDPGQMDRFTGLTLMSLRNRKEAFDFKNLLVQRIELQTKIKKMTLVKDKENWVIEGDAKTPVDQGAVRSLISRLSDSAVTEYLDKKEQAAFINADNKLVLKGKDQELLFELSWGPALKKKAVVGERTLILTRSNLFKDVFGLDQSVIESWGLMNLIASPQNKEKPKEEPL